MSIAQQQAKVENELMRLDEEITALEQVDPAKDEFRDVNNTDDDDAAESENHSRIQARLDAARQARQVVKKALDKLKDGSYGKCERCGKPIPEGRLEAKPWAIYDVECEEIIEDGRH